MRLLKHILLALAIAFPAFADTNVNTKTLQESLDSIDNWLGALAASAGATNVQAYLPGTNIAGATFNSLIGGWSIDFPGLERESAAFYHIPNVSSSVVVSITNGQYQSLEITNNVYISFEAPAISRNNELYLWLINKGNHLVNFDETFVLLDSTAPAITNSQDISLLFRYRTNPFFSKWFEQFIPVAQQTQVSTNVTVVASGGVITTNGNYIVHTFNSNEFFTVTTGGEVDILAVGGGGGGGAAYGGGGGGGGVVREYLSVVVTSMQYAVTVGSGGAGGFAIETPSSNVSSNGLTGGSSFISIGGVNYIAQGGGGGGKSGGPDGSSIGESGFVGGGSGGGASGFATGSDGGNGGSSFSWYSGGGGGGAADNGANASKTNAGNGGNGFLSYFRLPSGEFFGGGGGGGGTIAWTEIYSNPGSGGSGGGGSGGVSHANGSLDTITRPSNGSANTGGGGGGGAAYKDVPLFGGDGGSGVVIIRYLAAP